jgi:CheY-like chemotaxis protein
MCLRLLDVQAQRRTGGTGLGLFSLSKRAESLGGSCGVHDRADGGRGSCFWISIPYNPDELDISNLSKRTILDHDNRNLNNHEDKLKHVENDVKTFTVPVSTLETNDIPTSLRILLVDDSVLIRKTTSRSLSKEGYTVEVAQDGADCLKILEAAKSAEGSDTFPFDVILMDMQMPVMDGLEATKRIREIENTSMRRNNGKPYHIVIIGISANTESEARADCFDSGMDGFMEKPLLIKDFQKYYSKLLLLLKEEEIGSVK